VSSLDQLRFDANDLIPAIIQDHANGQVLMMAWMNRASLERTLETGLCTYWSRSRQKFWVKGETSGHVQHVKNVSVDCDQDCLLITVEQVGAACHDNYRTCFYRDLRDSEFVTNSEPL
jgi:phosphoribosyl-AMP cyclohydrolase